jgi:hypothetical protein
MKKFTCIDFIVETSVIHVSGAPFIKNFYYEALYINYVTLKLRFAKPPLPSYVTLFLHIDNNT